MTLRLTVLVLLALVAVPTAGQAAKRPSILYALDARGPSVIDAEHLSLPAAAHVTWFTDRPARRSGQITLGELVRLWDASGFRADPPNAALLLASQSGTRTHVVTLARPSFMGSRVVFRMRRIPGATEAGYADHHRLHVGAYARAALFIDDAAVAPCFTVILYGDSSGQCLLPPGADVEFYPQNLAVAGHVGFCASVSATAPAIGPASFDGGAYAVVSCADESVACSYFEPCVNGTPPATSILVGSVYARTFVYLDTYAAPAGASATAPLLVAWSP